MIERIDTKERSSAVVKHGGVAYLSGQVCEGDSIEAQTRGCLDQIDALLGRAGSSRERLLQSTIWLADMGDFAAMNAVWNAWVPPGHAPGPRLRRGEARPGHPEGGDPGDRRLRLSVDVASGAFAGVGAARRW